SGSATGVFISLAGAPGPAGGTGDTLVGKGGGSGGPGLREGTTAPEMVRNKKNSGAESLRGAIADIFEACVSFSSVSKCGYWSAGLLIYGALLLGDLHLLPFVEEVRA